MSRSSPPTLTSPRHGRLRRRLAHSTALAGMLAAAPVAAQLPTGESVEGGVAAGVIFDRLTDADTLGVSLTGRRSVINWETFNVDAGKTVDFRNTLPTTTVPVAVLNRVIGTPGANNAPRTITSSVINGSMTSASNISVYLVNPAGILIGSGGTVSVGSLVLSSRAINSRSFNAFDLDANQGDLPFAVDAADPANLVANPDAVRTDVLGRVIVGDQTSGGGSIVANAGIVALIAAKVETYGSITANPVERTIAGDPVQVGGEVAIVAADDVTLTLNGGSPMGVTIAAGTVLATPVLVRGTVAGRSILAAAATQQTVTDALLDVQGTLTATTATATDRGIVLAAGRTTTLASGIALPTAVAGDQPARLRLGGSLTANGPAGTIDVRARDGIIAPVAVPPDTVAPPRATLSADGSVFLRADGGPIQLGTVASRLATAANGIDILASTGAISLGAVNAGSAATPPAAVGSAGSNASIVATGDAVTLDSLFAGKAAAVSGTAVTIAGAVTAEAGTLDVTATRAALQLGSTTSAGLTTLRAATSATVTGQSISTQGAIDVRGGSVSLSTANAATALDVTSTGTTLDLGNGVAGTAATIAAATTANVVSLSAGTNASVTAGTIATLSGPASAGNDLSVTGTQVRLGGASGAEQVAGRNATYTATAGTITGTTSATGLVVRADNLAAGTGAIILDASTGIDTTGIRLTTGPANGSRTGDVGIRLGTAGAALTLGTVQARSLLSVSAAPRVFSPLTTTGNVTLGTTELVNTLALSTPGTISLGSITLSAPTASLSVTGSGAANPITATGTLTAPNGVTVRAPGAVELAAIGAGTGAATLESTGASLNVTGSVTGASASLTARTDATAGAVQATNGDARITGTTGAATVTNLSASRDAFLNASTTATLRGGGTAIRDLIVSGADVRLGGTTGEQRAGRNADFTARNGTIAALSGGTITIRGDATGSGAGRIILDASTGINLAGSELVTGDPNLATNTGEVAIRLATATAPLTLGKIDARGLVSVNAARTAFTPFTTSGPVTLGATRLVNGLTLSTPGTISLSSLAVSGPNQTLAIRGTGAATAVTATGELSATAAVTVSAPGAVTLADVTGGSIDIASSAAALTAGELEASDAIVAIGGTSATIASATSTGAGITAIANNGDLLTGNLSAGTLVQAGALNSAVLGDVTTGTGLAFLIAVNGALTAGAVDAGANVFGQAGTDLRFDSAQSRLDRVELLTQSGRIDVTGAVISNNFVSVNAATSAALDSVTDRGTGASQLVANAGTLTVANATSVGGPLVVGGSAGVTMGAVTSTGGSVTIGSTGGSVGVGPVSAFTNADVTARNDVTLGGLFTTSGTGSIQPVTGSITVNGDVDTQGAFLANAPAAVTLSGAVTSRSGAVTLASANSTLAAGDVSAAAALTATGPLGVTLGSARSGTAAVTLAADAGPLSVTGTTQGGGNVDVRARDAVGLGAVISDTGTVALLSTGGAIDATAVTTRLTLNANAATTLGIGTGTIGGLATLTARDVTLGPFVAGALRATANLGDLTITTADVGGEATLAKTGAAGGISIARLTAAGPTQITSAGTVRADRLEGGTTTVTAAGDISGRTGGLSAAVSSLTVNSTGGAATIATVTTAGTASISARNAALLAEPITAGGDLIARGGSVTLGTGGTTVAQVATGQVQVTSTAGGITGLNGLELRSNRTGIAGSGRDLTLQSAGGIAFAPGTLLAGGSTTVGNGDRRSDLRIGAASGAAIALDAVEVRTILSNATSATRFAHDGPVSIARVATGETLDVALGNAANLALALGPVEVRSGNLSLDATGALTTGTIGVLAGTTTLAGGTLSAGAIITRALTATARTGAATFATVEASAGGIAATAATDLTLTDAIASAATTLAAGTNVRLTSATAGGALTVTSATGDVTGNATASGFAPATLTSTGGLVSVRADATDGTGGAILVGAVAGRGGVDLAGRSITAETLSSAAGGVTASTARDLATITSQPMTIGTIDAAGTITLATGNRAAASSAPLSLDRATSTGGNIAITTIGGGLGARGSSPRTILSAPAGTITLAIGGSAVLGSASARATAITGSSLDITEAVATNGDLALATTNGAMLLGSGTASGSATLAAATDIDADRVTAGAALTANAGRDATLATLEAGGDMRLAAARVLRIGSATTPALLALSAPQIAATTLRAGSLDVSGGGGRITLADTIVTGPTAISSDGALGLDTFTAAAADLVAGTDLTASTLDVAGALTLTAGTIAVNTLGAGTLVAEAGAGGFDLETGTVAGAASITSGSGVAFRTLTAASGNLAAATDLTGTTLTVSGGLSADAGRDLLIDQLVIGGDASLSAVRTLTVNGGRTTGALTLAADTVTATTIEAGSLGITAGAGGLTLGTATVGGLATLVSGADIGIGSLTAGGIDIGATGALTADLLAASNGLAITAASARVTTTRVTGGTTRIRAGDDGLVLDDLVTVGGLDALTTGVLTSGTLDIGGRLDATGASASFATTRVAGDAAFTATAGSLVVDQAEIGGNATLTGATDVTATSLVLGGSLGATAASADVRLVRAGSAALTTTGGDLRVSDITTTGDLSLTSAATLTADRVAAGGTLTGSAAGNASVATATVTGNASLTAGGGLTLGSITTPAQLTLAARGITAATIGAGLLSARAGAGGADLRTATIAGAADLASEATLTIGTLTAGTARIVAAEAFAADTLTARDRLDVSGRSVRITRTAVSAGPAAITAAGGDLSVTTATVAGAATLTASGALSADTLDVAGDLTGSAAAMRIGTGTVRTGSARLTATTGGMVLGTATVAGDTILTAAGTIEAGTLATGRSLSATGGAVTLRQVSAGGAATLTARDAALAIADGRFAADTSLAARTALTADQLATGGALAATGDTIGLGTATVAGDATITGRAVTLGSFTANRALTLTAPGSATIDALRVGGRFTSASGALAGRSLVIGGDASLTGGSVALTNAAAAGSLTIDVTGRAAVDTLDVGGRLTATTPTLVFGTAAIRGGSATMTVGTVEIGQLTTSGTTGIVARGALSANRIDATGITASAASATVGQAVARAGDLALTTTGGDVRLGTASASGAIGLTSSGAATVTGAVTAGGAYRIDAASIALGTAGATARQAGADVTLLARTGTVGAQGSTTIAGGRAVAITARGANGAIALAPETTISSGSADVSLATTGAAALGTVTGSTAIRLESTDATLTRALTAPVVTLANVAASGVTRIGDATIGNETEFGAGTTRFDLTSGEVNLIAAPTVTIASGPRDVVLGTVALGAQTGATRFAITANGRIDMLGRFVAANSTASRTIAIGNDASGTTGRTGVIRIAATQADGGRLLVDGAVLELTAERIGAGLDRDFLDAIGYRTASGLEVEQVTQQYVARPTSTLYAPGALGAAPYTDALLVRSGVLRLTYGRYALFQNTGLPGQQTGVVLGTAGDTSAGGPKLRLATPNSTGNAFALFGTIDGISSQATALLGPDRLEIASGVSPVASRINGCIIGSGGGCLNTNLAQPSLNLFDTSRAEIVRTADDLTLPFDPLIGTNNEALYLDTIGDQTAPDCGGDQPCPTQP